MKFFEPTNEQSNAIDCDTCAVITACPGSGKTAVLSAKVRNVLTNSPEFKGVIAISYTNKASTELRKRCAENAYDIKRSYFGTIDKFCISEIILPFFPFLFDGCTGKPEIISKNKLDGDDLTVFENSAEGAQVFLRSMVTLYRRRIVVLESVGKLALEILRKVFACKRYICARYTHVFIDEYQDSGKFQHELFLELKGLGLVATAVGDVRQSIYAFAGRDPKFLLELCKDGSGFEKFELTQNHRSHPSIINYSNRILDKDSHLIEVDKLRVYRSTVDGSQIDIAAWIDKKIEKIREVFDVKNNRDIAILTRGNLSGEILGQTLVTPCKISKDSILDASSHRSSKQFAAILRMRYDENSTIQGLIDDIDFQGDRNTKKLLKSLLRQCKIGEDDILLDSMIRIQTIIDGVAPLPESIEELRLVLADIDEVAALTPANDNQIQLMTLHKSKGLEFDVVIHVDLYDWILPKRTVVDGSYDEYFPEWEQCLNLHYVGVTRAKKASLLVTSTTRFNAQGQTKKGNPSQFFTQLPGLDNLYKKLK